MATFRVSARCDIAIILSGDSLEPDRKQLRVYDDSILALACRD